MRIMLDNQTKYILNLYKIGYALKMPKMIICMTSHAELRLRSKWHDQDKYILYRHKTKYAHWENA